MLDKLVLAKYRNFHSRSSSRRCFASCSRGKGHQGIVRMTGDEAFPKDEFRRRVGVQVLSYMQSGGGVPEPMKRVEPPTGPWQDKAIDLTGPLPTEESLLVVVDYLVHSTK